MRTNRFSGYRVEITTRVRAFGHRKGHQFIISPELGQVCGIKHKVVSDNHYASEYNAQRAGLTLAKVIFPGARRECIDDSGNVVWSQAS